MLEGIISSNAVLDFDFRRPADHDGATSRSEALFSYFRLEDQIPENHLLRLIDQHVSFEFVRQQLKDSYSETGRPSIDPELLLRILLMGYLDGIIRERRLVEELRKHLAWRWFTGLGFDQEIPHHSTFSKNRHGQFQESKLFEAVIRANRAAVSGSGIGTRQEFVRRRQFRGSAAKRCGNFVWWLCESGRDCAEVDARL